MLLLTDFHFFSLSILENIYKETSPAIERFDLRRKYSTSISNFIILLSLYFNSHIYFFLHPFSSLCICCSFFLQGPKLIFLYRCIQLPTSDQTFLEFTALIALLSPISSVNFLPPAPQMLGAGKAVREYPTTHSLFKCIELEKETRISERKERKEEKERKKSEQFNSLFELSLYYDSFRFKFKVVHLNSFNLSPHMHF